MTPRCPGVAVFSTWEGTQDVGWVRYTFDQYKVPYDLIFKERVDQGDLAKDYDLILIPTQVRNAKDLVFGIPAKPTSRCPTRRSDRFKFLGDYGSSPDITGGMGGAGVVEFQKFVDDGGMLVTLGASSSFPPDFGLTPTIETSNPAGKFYAPGPIVQADILRPENPIFYGYSEKTVPVRYANGPAAAHVRRAWIKTMCSCASPAAKNPCSAVCSTAPTTSRAAPRSPSSPPAKARS